MSIVCFENLWCGYEQERAVEALEKLRQEVKRTEEASRWVLLDSRMLVYV
jgi:hypothetical protein